MQLEDMDLLFGPDVPILASKARMNYIEARNARVAVVDHLEQKNADIEEV